MRWLLTFAVLAASLSIPVAIPGTAHACSCAYTPDGPRILQHVAHAAGVFTGTATAQRIDGDTAYYEFDVREVFTGEIGDSTDAPIDVKRRTVLLTGGAVGSLA